MLTTFAAVAAHASEIDLPHPPEVRSEHGVAKLTLTAVYNPKTGLPALSFQGGLVPPTIRVNPGDHIKITYVNDLPISIHSSFANMTNLHFHGLKTSPNEPADDVLDILLMPGQSYNYDVPIPADESPGLYWYHPHPHGESNRQTAGGMSGAIVVSGIEKYYPEAAHVPERILIMRDLYPRGYPVPALRLAQHPALRSGSQVICTGAGSREITINGVKRPTIFIRPGETQFWRFVNASANSYADIQVDGAKLAVIARDGEPIVYRDRGGTGVLYSHYLLGPANRVEFFITGPSIGNATLHSLCVDTGPVGNITPNRVLADLDYRRSGGSPLVLGPPGLLPSHKPLVDIRSLPIAASKTIVFTEDDANGLYYINGQLYDPNKAPSYFAKLGTVEAWTIVNRTQQLHVFHIHQLHFLVLDPSPPTPAHPLDFQDSVTVPYAVADKHGTLVPGKVHLLMDFTDPIIKGTFVFHCHILEHEDGGMMQKITVR